MSSASAATSTMISNSAKKVHAAMLAHEKTGRDAIAACTSHSVRTPPKLANDSTSGCRGESPPSLNRLGEEVASALRRAVAVCSVTPESLGQISSTSCRSTASRAAAAVSSSCCDGGGSSDGAVGGDALLPDDVVVRVVRRDAAGAFAVLLLPTIVLTTSQA